MCMPFSTSVVQPFVWHPPPNLRILAVTSPKWDPVLEADMLVDDLRLRMISCSFRLSSGDFQPKKGQV